MSDTSPSLILSTEEIQQLKQAKYNLENISFMMKLFNTIGVPFESGIKLIPEKYQNKMHNGIQKALRLSVKANLKTMKTGKTPRSSNTLYKAVTGASGAAGGFFGVVGFTGDLVLSTKFMMRSILDIARSQGEDLQDIETQLACLEVFALGGFTPEDDQLETSYYALRAALHTTLNKAGAYIAENGTTKIAETLSKRAATPIANFINQIASRYSIQVGEKFAAQAVPVIGAAAGASINILFITHFQKMATAHFFLRKLERKHGKDYIRKVYEDLSVEKDNTSASSTQEKNL